MQNYFVGRDIIDATRRPNGIPGLSSMWLENVTSFDDRVMKAQRPVVRNIRDM